MNIQISDSSIYECGKGWHRIINNARRLIEDNINAERLQYLYIEQIKEKFGGLRIYLSESTDEIENIITGAEILASITCEDCGTVENVGLSSGGWMRTLCENCHKKTNNTKFKIKTKVWASYEFVKDFNGVQAIGSYVEVFGSNDDNSKEYWRIRYMADRRRFMYKQLKKCQCFKKQRPSRKIRKQFNGY